MAPMKARRADSNPEPTGSLRIGIDIRELVAGRQTGIGRVLANFLGALQTGGAQVAPVLYGNHRTRLPQDVPPFPLRVMPESVTLWWDQVRLPRALREDEIAVFWSPYYKVPLRPPCPVVNTIHDLIPLTHGPWRERALFGLACRLYTGRAAATLTDSEFSRTCIQQRLGIPSEKLHVVPLAVSAELRPVDHAARRAVLSRYGLSTGYILTVTNFQPHKNLRRLLEAFRQLPEGMRRDHPLILVGDGPGRRSLERLRDGSGLRAGMLTLGNLPDADLPAFYAGAAVFVLPSLEEGFGLPALEAMACGTPVVCANSGALPEVAGDAALLVNPRDPEAIAAAIQKVLANADLAETFRARGLARAGHHTPERMASAIRRVLLSVVPGGSR